MSRRWLLMGLPLVGAMAWLAAQNATVPPSPLPFFPPGAMMTIEARDFGAMLREWSGSAVKREWLGTDAYKQFAVSRLFLRLSDAQQEFADVSKVGVDMTLVEQLAGDRTAVALYNPGDLQFLLVTRMTEARFAASVLGKQRATLSPRNAGGTPYFVASKAGSQRRVAFGLRGDWLIVATDENLLAGCLQRMASTQVNGLTTQDWFARAARLAGAPGELRMVLNMDALYDSPHFRSYWVHRNRTELAEFGSAVSDLDRAGASWTERRVLVRKSASSAATADSALMAALLKAVPAQAGLYRAWLAPAAGEVSDVVLRKLYVPGSNFVAERRLAPSASAVGEAGDENDWENRIDAAPFVPGASGPDAARLRRWLSASGVTGLLQVQLTKDSADGVWIGQETGLLLTRAGNWNAAEVRTELALLQGVDVASVVDGNRLFLSSSAPLLAAMRTGGAVTAPADARTVAVGGFRHGPERDRFARWMRMLDQPKAVAVEPGQQPQPRFIGDVVGGMSRTLRGVAEQTVSSTDYGDRVQQNVVYRWQ